MHRQQITTAGQLMDIATGYWQSSVLHCAVKLDIFTALGTTARTAAEVAAEQQLNPRALTTLLNALTAMGLLIKEDDTFANTEAGRRHLRAGEPHYLGNIILHHHHLVDGWNQLDTAIASGSAVTMRDFGEETERRNFLLGMHNIATSSAPIISQQVDLSDRTRLLDLGGGPGTYTVAFCQANPQLSAVVFDRPQTEPYLRATVAQAGLTKRIDFMAGDFTRDALPSDYDVAWLSQILHSNGPTACQEIIAKTVRNLLPGGLIMVHEFFLNDTKAGPLFPALFSLNMLLNNGDGRSYSAGEITAMLEKAGIQAITRLPYQGPNDAYILCGTKG